MMAVISPQDFPYLLRKYSGTVFTVAARNFGAIKLRIINAIPMVVMYQDAPVSYTHLVLGLGCKQTPHGLKRVDVLLMLCLNQEHHPLHTGLNVKFLSPVVDIHQQ